MNGDVTGWSLGPGKPGLATIVVTAFNQDWVLAHTLESVQAQTYRPLECVIVNDGSTDDTAAVIETFVRQHGQDITVKSIKQRNQGAQTARNTGVRLSCGDFIQFLDGDDILDPDKLEAQIRFFSSEGGQVHDVVYGDARWLHQNGESVLVGENLGLGPVSDILVGLLRLEKFNPLFSYLCRRMAVAQCGGWDPRFKINDDVDYFLRMACSSLGAGFGFAYVPGMTGLYRKHDRVRISDGGTLLRTQDTLAILRSIEAQMEAAHLLTFERRGALAHAYRRVSYWASTCDDAAWKESLAHALRLDPELMPERFMSRCLQRTLGPWRSESILRQLRKLKHRATTRANFTCRARSVSRQSASAL